MIESGADIVATGSAPITLKGTGGADNNPDPSISGLTDENSEGISLDAYDNGGGGDSPNISISSVNGAISLTGIAGSSIGQVSRVA